MEWEKYICANKEPRYRNLRYGFIINPHKVELDSDSKEVTRVRSWDLSCSADHKTIAMNKKLVICKMIANLIIFG